MPSQPMLYFLHHPDDSEEVKKKFIPLLEQREYELIQYPNSDFKPTEEDLCIAYLSDEYLREFLPRASKLNWKLGILPHLNNQFTLKGLGLEGKPEDTLENILKCEEVYKLDMLYCNGRPVFQSVNIGNVFIFTEEKKTNRFFSEVTTFVKNIARISELSHRAFLLSANDEKIIHTSALGLIAVEHPESSVIARRIIPPSKVNDGQFHILVVSPQNLFELLWFLFRSLLPRRRQMSTRPSFLGYIKTSNIKIENQADIDFTVDGEKYSARKIEIEVVPAAIRLCQESKHYKGEVEDGQKKTLKIDRLPTGERREELSKRTLPLLPRATTEEFQELFKVLRENAKTTSTFVVMMVLSTLIATFGLFGDSSPVIIGAMILAPIISPIVSFSMGMVRYDINMLKEGIITILIGTGVSLLFAAGVSLIIPLQVLTSEIDARLSPTLLDMGIAVASGIAAAYAHAKEGIAKSLAGVAIAVALVPPLAVAGIGIGWWDWNVFSGAFLLYLTNMAGIIMFAGITFLVLGFAPFKRARLGLVYTLILILLVMVPLSLSFNRITKEASITRQLEGSTFNKAVLRDVKVRFGAPLKVSLTLVGTENLEKEDMMDIKRQMEEAIGEPIELEVISARQF